MLERLEAFRALIRHGNSLLGEVVSYCHDAETAITQFAGEKQEIDRMRAALEEAQARAGAEADAARQALAQVDVQRSELSAMRAELVKARAGMEDFNRLQSQGAAALEQSLRDARQQQRHLEQELQRVQAQAASAHTLEHRLGELDQMGAKLRVAETELAETRRALEDERVRRDRAIALIKPKPVLAEARS